MTPNSKYFHFRVFRKQSVSGLSFFHYRFDILWAFVSGVQVLQVPRIVLKIIYLHFVGIKCAVELQKLKYKAILRSLFQKIKYFHFSCRIRLNFIGYDKMG